MRIPWKLLLLMLIVVVVTTAASAFRRNLAGEKLQSRRQLASDLPGQRRDTYVSSNQCRACHPAEYASWHRTFHRTMTQAATNENVVGRFDGTTVDSDGLTYRVFARGGEYWAEMPDPEEYMYVVQGGKPTPLEEIPRARRRVVMTTGSHHYQTYWVAGDDKFGNLLQSLPLVYLIKDQRWIPREAAFMRPPHGDRMMSQWNHHCIRCHSTGGVPGLSQEIHESGGFATRVGELGIACEACHGPGEEHVAFYRNPATRYAAYFSDQNARGIVNPQHLDHRRSSQVCGQCHSVFIMQHEYAMKYAYEGVFYRPGDDLHKTRYCIQHPLSGDFDHRHADLQRNPEFFRQRWWDDGTILAGGREFTAMSAAPCYLRGEMSCLSCHTMHHGDPNDQLKPEMETSRACTQCHADERFTTDVPQHTRHGADSVGSNCLNCHMPHSTYALFSAIRSHQITSPQTSSSIRHDVPNACNLCHLDQTIGWAQDQLADWYGQEKLPLDEDEQQVAAGVLWILRGGAAQRVITAWHAGWEPALRTCGNDWLAPHLATLLADPYGVVRYVAYRSLKTLPGFQKFNYDFLADNKELLQAADRAAVQWNDAATPQRRHAESLLIDGDGRLQVNRLLELIRRRDNRPVAIQE